MSGSCKLLKESLDPQIVAALNQTGVAVVPLPASKILKGKLDLKCCQQYAIPDFEENIVLLDTGHAKLMTRFFPLDLLRAIPGFENARYEDPYAGGWETPSAMWAWRAGQCLEGRRGRKPLLRRGKGGPAGGAHRGHLHRHAGRLQRGEIHPQRKRLVLPSSLTVGDAIQFVRSQMQEEGLLSLKYTFSGSVYFERMKAKGLYTTNRKAIGARVARPA